MDPLSISIIVVGVILCLSLPSWVIYKDIKEYRNEKIHNDNS